MKTFSGMRGAAGLLLVACSCLHAEVAGLEGTSALFTTNEVLEIGLVGPVGATITDRDDRAERRFRLVVDGAEQDVWVRVRGKSRSRRSICKFPPLRFRFEQGSGLFAGHEKLKLVTHCRNSERGDADVMEEYAAYRIFNLLSPVSLRVRPLRITYTDTAGDPGENVQQHYGFLIESVRELAERSGGEERELEGVALAWLDPDQAALVYVFQYLIGNTDWSFVAGDGSRYCCHNGRLLGIGDEIHYVPYDFDLAGLVSTRYAKPDPSLHLRSVRQRRYRGFCTDSGTLLRAIRQVVEREAEIDRIIRELPGLDEKQKQKDLAYVGEFFEQASAGNELLERFENRCLSE